MHDKNNIPNNLDQAKGSFVKLPVNRGRRRFNAAGIAASGVLMTVASRSALAAGACTAAGPSGVGSINTSVRPANSVTLACGLSPGYWAQHDQSYWPIPMTTDFKSVFKYGPNLSFIDVVSTTANDDNSQLYRHVAAEYLSMQQYPAITQYLTFDQLKLLLKLQYPSGATPWSASKVIAYLTQIQG